MIKKQVTVRETVPAQGRKQQQRSGRRRNSSLPPGTVVSSIKRKATQNGRKRIAFNPGIRFNPNERQYLNALLDPFADSALGCRVPNYVPCPTSVAKSEGLIALTSSATGTCGFVVMGCPNLGLLVTAGTISQLGGTSTMYSATTATGVNICPIANLQTRFEAMRLVSWGWRLRNNLSFSAVTGRVIIAPYVASQWQIPSEQLIAQWNTDGAAALQTGFNSVVNSFTQSAGVTGNILNLPGAKNMQMDQLINTDLLFAGRPAGPEAYAFRNSVNVTESDGVYFPAGPNGYVAVTGGAFTNGNVATTHYLGADWCSYMVIITGLPASTAFADLEYIYHYEGTPPPSNTPIVAATQAASSPVSTTTIEQIWQTVEKIGPAIEFAKPVIMKGANSLLTQIAKLAL